MAPRPSPLGEFEVIIKASIGIAIYPVDGREDRITVEREHLQLGRRPPHEAGEEEKLGGLGRLQICRQTPIDGTREGAAVSGAGGAAAAGPRLLPA